MALAAIVRAVRQRSRHGLLGAALLVAWVTLSIDLVAAGCDGTTTVVTETSGTLALGSFDSATQCSWVIAGGAGFAVSVQVTRIDIEEGYDTLTLYSGANSDPEAVLAQYKGELRPYEEVLPILLGNHSARVEFDGGGVGGHTGFDVTFRVYPAECAPGAVHVNGTATGLISTNPLGGVLPGGLECVWILYLPDPGASVRLALQAMAVPNSATVEIRDGHLPSSPLLARIDNTRNFRTNQNVVAAVKSLRNFVRISWVHPWNETSHPRAGLTEGEARALTLTPGLNAGTGVLFSFRSVTCSGLCSQNGACVRGECQCLNEAVGLGCYVPTKWKCNASNYGSGDGCDCGCDVWDPDCDGLWPNNNDCPASERIRLERADVLDWDDRCFHCPITLPRHFGNSFTQPAFKDRVETRVSFPGSYNPFPEFPFNFVGKGAGVACELPYDYPPTPFVPQEPVPQTNCHFASTPQLNGNPMLVSRSGVCLVASKIAMCQPPNPCGSPTGVIAMTTRSGTFSDGYDLYPALVSCEFQIDPIIAAPMRPFAQLKVTFLRVQLGPASPTDPSATTEEHVVLFDGETDTDAELVRWDSSADYTGVTDQLATRLHALVRFNGVQNMTRSGFEASYTLQLTPPRDTRVCTTPARAVTNIDGVWPDAMLLSNRFLANCDWVIDVTGSFPPLAPYQFIRVEVYINGLRQGHRAEFYDGTGAGAALITTLYPGDPVESLRIVSTSTVMTIKIISTGPFEAGGGLWGSWQGDWCNANVNCSSHGSCAAGGYCMCDDGFSGTHCEERYMCIGTVPVTYEEGDLYVYDPVKKAAADKRSDWYAANIVSTLGEGLVSVDSRPVVRGYPAGMVCQWQFSRPSSDLELSFVVWEPDGAADNVNMFAGTTPAADQLALTVEAGDALPTPVIYNGTEWLLRFRSASGHSAIGRGLHIHYLFHRTWYVGPPELVGQDHRVGVWSAPVGSVWEAVRRASHMDTIVVYPGRYARCGIEVHDKSVIVKSLSGWQFTKLDCAGTDNGFVVSGGGHLKLAGLEIVGARTAVVVEDGARVTADSVVVSNSLGAFRSIGRTQLVVRDSIVRSNNGRAPSVIDASGACEIHVTNCVFSDNQAADEGIIRVNNGGSLSMNAIQVLNNLVQRRGIMWFVGSSVSMTTVTFTDNAASGGSAFMYLHSSTVSVADTVVSGVSLPASRTLIEAVSSRVSFRAMRVTTQIACPSSFVDTVTSMDDVSWTGPGNLGGADRPLMVGVPPGVVASFTGGQATLTALTVTRFTGADAVTVNGGAQVNVSLSTFSAWVTAGLRPDTRAAFITAWGRGTSLTTEGVGFTSGNGHVGGALSIHSEAVHRSTDDTFTLCSSSTDGGALHVERAVSSMVRASFTKCTAVADGGAVAAIGKSRVSMHESTISDATAGGDGGCLFAHAYSVLAMHSTQLSKCTAGKVGGAVLVGGVTRACLSFVSVTTALAAHGGGVAVTDRAQVLIRNSTVTSARATQHGGCLYMVGARQLHAHLTDPLVAPHCGDLVSDWDAVSLGTCTAAGVGGAAYIADSAVAVNRFTAHTSTAQSGAGVALIASQLSATRADIRDNTATAQGGGLYAMASSFEGSRCRVLRNIATSGGGIHAFLTPLAFTDSTVEDNIAVDEGGGMTVADGRLSLMRCQLNTNTAGSGGGVAADGAEVTIHGTVVSGNLAVASSGGGLDVLRSPVFTVTNTTLSYNTARGTAGGGLNAVHCGQVRIHGTTFFRNTAGSLRDYGNLTTTLPFAPLVWNVSNQTAFVPTFGVIEPSQLEPIDWPVRGGGARVETTTGLATVILCRFEGNNALSAGLGGGLYNRNKQYLLSELGFYDNYADGFGAGLYDTVGLKATDRHPKGSQVVEWCNFTRNDARGGGGGIYWVLAETQHLLARNNYLANTAKWGPQYASYRKTLDADDVPQQDYQPTSGKLFDVLVTVKIVDHYGQVITTDSGLRVWGAAANPRTFVLGNPINVTWHGVATFTEIGMIGTPGVEYRFRFSAEGVGDARAKFKLRDCHRGELEPRFEHGVLGKLCFPCPMGMFSYNLDDYECSLCPVGAVCLGGDHSIALNGYWRTKNSTFGVWDTDLNRFRLAKCLDAEGCKGAPYVEMFPGRGVDLAFMESVRNMQEGCRAGYAGTLCNRCAPGSGRRGKTTCTACSPGGVGGEFFLGLVFMYLVISFVVFPTLWEATHRTSRVFLLIKPFFSFMQLQALGVWFYINWPEGVATLFNGYETLSLYSEQVFPLDCMFGEVKNEDVLQGKATRLAYKKILWYIFLPAFGGALAAVNWFIVYCWRWWYVRRHHALVGVSSKNAVLNKNNSRQIEGARIPKAKLSNLCKDLDLNLRPKELQLDDAMDAPHNMQAHIQEGIMYYTTSIKLALYEGVRNLLYGKWGTTFQVINFVVYPSLARVCLGLQKCVQLDDGKRKPFIDLDESCGSGNYSMYSGLTGFLAGSYLVGYPMLMVYLLRQNKPYFHEKFVHGRFVWLITGLKPDLYWWDVVILARKAIIVAIIVFVGPTENWGFALLLGMIAVIAALVVQVHARPYEVPAANRLEEASLLATFLTWAVGLHFYNDEPLNEPWKLSLATLLILAINVVYILYWAAEFLFLLYLETQEITMRLYAQWRDRKLSASKVAVLPALSSRRSMGFEVWDPERASDDRSTYQRTDSRADLATTKGSGSDSDSGLDSLPTAAEGSRHGSSVARKSRKQSYEAHDGFVQRALHAAEVHPEDMGDNRTVLQGGGLNPSEALLVELEAEDKAAKDAEDVLGISAPEAWGELGDGKADPGREAGLNEALGNMSDDSEQEVKPVGRQVEVGSIPVAGLREIIRDDTGDHVPTAKEKSEQRRQRRRDERQRLRAEKKRLAQEAKKKNARRESAGTSVKSKAASQV